MSKITTIQKIYGSIASRERKERQAKEYQERLKMFKEREKENESVCN